MRSAVSEWVLVKFTRFDRFIANLDGFYGVGFSRCQAIDSVGVALFPKPIDKDEHHYSSYQCSGQDLVSLRAVKDVYHDVYTTLRDTTHASALFRRLTLTAAFPIS